MRENRPLASLVGLGSIMLTLSLACFSPKPQAGLACSETGQCPPGQTCVADVCELCPAEGCPAADAMQPDAMPICDNETCTEVCGDANQDGAFDAGDVTDLGRLVAGEIALCTCGNADADLDRDGDVDSRDAAFAQALLDGELTDGCASCFDCGDANLDGEVDGVDYTAVEGLVGHGIITVCQFAVADVDANGVIEQVDSLLARAMVTGAIDGGGCQPCPAASCGDVNLDGSVNSSDTDVFNSFPGSVTLCQFVAADLDKDGEIGVGDEAISAAAQADSDIDAVCEACTNVCGDVDQNGVLESADVADVLAFATGPASSIEQCQFDGGNLRQDGELNLRDWSLVDGVQSGRLIGCFNQCTGVCGDANQDGTVTAADGTVADDWRQSMNLPATTCGWDAADLDGDGAITSNEVEDINSLAPTCQDWIDFL